MVEPSWASQFDCTKAMAPASIKAATSADFTVKKLSDLAGFIVEVFGDVKE